MTECVSACETIKGWDYNSKTCFKIEIDRWRWIKLILTNRLLSSVWEEILVQLWLRSYNLLPVYCICDVNTWNSQTEQLIERNFQCMILAVMRPFSSYYLIKWLSQLQGSYIEINLLPKQNFLYRAPFIFLSAL